MSTKPYKTALDLKQGQGAIDWKTMYSSIVGPSPQQAGQIQQSMQDVFNQMSQTYLDVIRQQLMVDMAMKGNSYTSIFVDDLVSYNDSFRRPIDPPLLSVQNDRDEKHMKIDFRQIHCRCKFTTLIRLEYSTDGTANDAVKFTCPACGDVDNILLDHIHPDGANIKIIETWKDGTEVTWDKQVIPQPKEALQIHQIEVVNAYVVRDHYANERELKVSIRIKEETLKLAKSKRNVLTMICDKLSQHVYDYISGGLY